MPKPLNNQEYMLIPSINLAKLKAFQDPHSVEVFPLVPSDTF
jgi:hypothetical protein